MLFFRILVFLYSTSCDIITRRKNSVCVVVFLQCGLPSLEECKDLAEEAQSQGEILQAVKYHLLGPEPEKALPIAIALVKGVCVRM